ncbi:hypothetical protein JCM17960_28000 [Magnetospira thiophila]
MPRTSPKPLIRWLLYGVIAVATLGLGYGLGTLFRDPAPAAKKVSQEIPYYQRDQGWEPLHSPPLPPIFPDPIEELAHLDHLPYEEALPHDIYEGPDSTPVTPPEAALPQAPKPFLPPLAATPPPAVEVEETSAVALLARAPRPNHKPRNEMPPPRSAPVGKVIQDLFPLEPPGAAPQVASLPPPTAPSATVPSGTLGGGPVLAVVIDDLGVDQKRTAQAIALPGPLTLSFLTYAEDLSSQTAAAQAAGHELLVHVPMQPGNAKLDPGPEVLEVGLDAAEIRHRLDWGLSQFTGYVGINNHMGSKFTEDLESLTVVMQDLKERGLFFLDSRTSGATKGPEAARRVGLPFVMRNVFLDNVNRDDAVTKQLEILERLARRNGRAVAICHPRDATIRMLQSWLPGLAAKGITLVPVSRLVRDLG